MSESKGGNVPKRFFVQGTVELHKLLQHLAIDVGTSAEKLAGELLKEAAARKQEELRQKKR